MKRRNLLKLLGGLSLAPLSSFTSALDAPPKRNPKRVLRIAHLTDIHLEDKNQAPQLFANTLHLLQNLKDKPDLIFNGGDTIMDALGRDKGSVEKQWQLWDQVIREECSLEVVNCIGNHDVWGAGPKDDPLYGKQYALEKMQLDSPYYSFERAGWQFIILDSTHPVDDGWYTGKLDDVQFDWLKTELENTPSDRPILLMSHIPILTASAFYEENRKENKWMVPGSWMHIDFNRIKDLFLKHPNVKLCISGHMHLLDHVVYNGVTYMCNGAVSGSWWGGKMYHETEAGFALIDLYKDGTFNREYITEIWD